MVTEPAQGVFPSSSLRMQHASRNREKGAVVSLQRETQKPQTRHQAPLPLGMAACPGWPPQAPLSGAALPVLGAGGLGRGVVLSDEGMLAPGVREEQQPSLPT